VQIIVAVGLGILWALAALFLFKNFIGEGTPPSTMTMGWESPMNSHGPPKETYGPPDNSYMHNIPESISSFSSTGYGGFKSPGPKTYSNSNDHSFYEVPMQNSYHSVSSSGSGSGYGSSGSMYSSSGKENVKPDNSNTPSKYEQPPAPSGGGYNNNNNGHVKFENSDAMKSNSKGQGYGRQYDNNNHGLRGMIQRALKTSMGKNIGANYNVTVLNSTYVRNSNY